MSEAVCAYMKKITVEFQTADRELDDLIMIEFEKEQIQYPNQFTGHGLISVVLSATSESMRKVVAFFRHHRDSLKTAIVRTSEGVLFSLFEYAEKQLLLIAIHE